MAEATTNPQEATVLNPGQDVNFNADGSFAVVITVEERPGLTRVQPMHSNGFPLGRSVLVPTAGIRS